MNLTDYVQRMPSPTLSIKQHLELYEILPSITPAELTQCSDTLKGQFDDLLDNNLEAAGQIADFMTLLGTIAVHRYATALGIMAQADYLRERGQRSMAITLYDQAAALFKEDNHDVGWARTRSGRLHAVVGTGTINADDIVEAYNGLAILVKSQHIERAVSGVGMALCTALRYLCRYDEVTVLFQTLIAYLFAADMQHMPADDDMRAEYQQLLAQNDTTAMYTYALTRQSAVIYAKLIANYGHMLVLQGNIDAAKHVQQMAYMWFLHHEHKAATARQLMNLAAINRIEGYHDVAIKQLAEAINLFEQKNQANFAATARIAWADMQLTLNRPQVAFDEIEKVNNAIDLHQSQVDWVQALHVKGKIYIHMQRISEGMAYLEEGITAMVQAKFMLNAVYLVVEQGEILLQQKLWHEAAQLISHTLATFGDVIQQVAHVAGLLTAISAQAALGLHDLATAAALARTALQLGTGHIELRYRCNTLLAAVHRDPIYPSYDLAICRQYLDAAIHDLKQITLLLVLNQRAHYLEDKDDIFMTAVSVALAQGDHAGAFAYVENQRAIADWTTSLAALDRTLSPEQQHEYQELRANHRLHSALLISLQKGGIDQISQANIEAAYQRLSRIETTIDMFIENAQRQSPMVLDHTDQVRQQTVVPTTLAFAVCNQDIAVFVITPQLVTARILLDSTATVQRCLHTIERNLEATMQTLKNTGDPTTLTEWNNHYTIMMTKLYQILVQPIAAYLPAEGEPLVIVPHNFLWSLPIASLYDGHKYLMERFVLNLAPSYQSVKQPRQRPAEPILPPLVMEYALAHATDMEAAESTEAAIIALLIDADVWLDAAATVSAFMANAVGRRNLHIAAHGAARITTPDSSYIQLYDSPLHPLDIIGLDLSACQLATLGICDANWARTTGGDVQLGMVRAFLKAGAASVLASLWKIESQATTEFMRLFYTEIVAGTDAAHALQRTQVAMQRSSRSHPYFWASFRLTIA